MKLSISYRGFGKLCPFAFTNTSPQRHWKCWTQVSFTSSDYSLPRILVAIQPFIVVTNHQRPSLTIINHEQLLYIMTVAINSD